MSDDESEIATFAQELVENTSQLLPSKENRKEKKKCVLAKVAQTKDDAELDEMRDSDSGEEIGRGD